MTRALPHSRWAALAIGKSVDYTRVEVDPAIYTDYVGVYDIDDSQDFSHDYDF